ncbi:MAG: class I SAM-dependent methyltransferase [Chitinophagales bacterium]|nr:class I SAM-dependent methyltransferase [Chitinophagales bacterium]
MSILKQKEKQRNPSEGVAEFYNATTDKFLQVYGEVIQAFRTNNVSDYLDYTINSAQLQSRQHIIDAGCGVAGPACYFATQLPELKIEACTISEVQQAKANEKIAEKNLQSRVRVTLGDYHKLPDLFPENSFDRVIFLESFGHSKNKTLAIESAYKVLKPGGKLYIKDLFVRESNNEWEQLRINHICEQINEGYAYEVGDIHQVFSAIRRQGFILNFIRPPQVDLSQFEHLSISNEFQNLFNVSKIDSWDGYVFPIDFYEILAEKPPFTSAAEMHLYYMNR